MKIPIVISRFLWILSICVFLSCSEDTIPYPLDKIPLQLDTLILYNKVTGTSYQTPPEMGSLEKLYLGSKNGFINLFTLIQISSQSSNTTFEDLLKDSISIDNVILKFSFSVDTLLADNPVFRLSFFPDDGDSIFHEYNTNYKNFDISNFTPIILGETYLAQAEPESSETVTPELIFDSLNVVETFSGDTLNIVETFSDSVSNRTFLLEVVGGYDDLISFKSRETGDGPNLSVYYQETSVNDSDVVVIDTLYRIFPAIKDLSVLTPPDTTTEDVTMLAVGRGKGLKSLIQLNLDTLSYLPEQILFRSETYLNLFYDAEEVENFSVFAFPLADTVNSWDFTSFIEKDPYDINGNYALPVIWDNGKIKIRIQSYLQYVKFNNLTNLGIKLYGSTNNDPFQTVYFYSYNGEVNSLNPYITVQYVAP